MTRDEIIKLAREADPYGELGKLYEMAELTPSTLERFANLVAAAERDACIALRGHEDVQAPIGNSAWGEAYQEGWIDGTSAYRDAIRARGEKGQS